MPKRPYKNRLNDLDPKAWLKFQKSWFVHNPPRRARDVLRHPAKFPETLAQDDFEFCTKRDQVVLDPMVGTGSTLVAALRAGNDFFVGSDGTIFSTGQFVNDSVGLYVSGVSENGDRRFELFRRYEFEENGLFIRPYGSSHLLVCGYSKDGTGTFNIRLLMMTLGGETVWDTTYGVRGGISEVPNDIKVDSHGNIVVGGISQFSEIRYLLLKFSPAGSLLWSIESQPIDGGCFEVHEVLLDANDNIYGITNNTFVADTSHGTIFKWDPEGNVQWQKNMPMIRKSGSPLPVGSVASQSTRASVAARRVWLQLPCASPRSGSPTSSQAEPLDFRWLTATVKRPPVERSWKVWASTGRLLVSRKRGSSVESRIWKAPIGVTTAGL